MSEQTVQKCLQAASISRLDAEVLLAQVLDVTRNYLHAWPEKQLNIAQMMHWQNLLNRRTNGEPIAYLIEEKEFWSLPLAVNPATLIPRPETELLVELVLKHLPCDSPQSIVDLGTGSGAIALALASECPQWQLLATDQSPQALQVAQINAKRLKCNNVEFQLGNWFTALTKGKRYHAIVSNPPYIAENDPHLLAGDVRFEPRTALVAGQDGLASLQQIIEGASHHLVSQGWLLLEHGYDQAHQVYALMQSAGYRKINGYQDIAGCDRVTIGQL